MTLQNTKKREMTDRQTLIDLAAAVFAARRKADAAFLAAYAAAWDDTEIKHSARRRIAQQAGQAAADLLYGDEIEHARRAYNAAFRAHHAARNMPYRLLSGS